MAQILKSMTPQQRLIASRCPPEVCAQITQGELYDRIAYAESLNAQANRATGGERRAYGEQARAVLCAQPRATTERQVAETIAKAAACPSPPQAAAIRAQAADLLEKHPPAPRRSDSAAVAKARAADGGDDLVVIFDQAGNAVGVCGRNAIQPLATTADIAKARAGKARAPQGTRRPPGRP
jgi:hypothetical protein